MKLFSKRGRFRRSSAQKGAVLTDMDENQQRPQSLQMQQREESFTNFEPPNFDVDVIESDGVSFGKQSQFTRTSQNNDTASSRSPQSDQPQFNSKDGLDDSEDSEDSNGLNASLQGLDLSGASSMSFGSQHPDDSFIAVSATGMSSDESSINSRYLDVHPPGSKRGNYENDGRGRNMSGGIDDDRLKPKTTTSSLPRLTVNTKQTRAFLDTPPDNQSNLKGDYQNQKQKQQERIQDLPISPTTVETEPETPVNRKTDNEFPVPDQSGVNTTPEIHIPSNLHTSHDASDFTRTKSTSSSTRRRRDRDRLLTKEKKMSKGRRMALAEKEFWELRLKEIIFQHGSNSIQAAKGMGNVGASLLRCQQYEEALVIYKKAVAVLRTHYGMNSLIVARGLDKIGLSASLCATPTNLDWAYIALKEALSIRICYLGPHHCDCADTLNNIAGVFMQKEDYETALGIYLDVLTIRAAIFGKNHPSIAITASTLGKVYQHLSDLDNALIHYNLAVAIYKGEPMNLKASHPLVSKVFKQISAIERLMVLLEEN